MIQNDIKSEADFYRFLLGEMSEDERGAFERKFIADDDLFGQICVFEDELIESNVRGKLFGAEKEKFERSFLATKRRRERVAFARSMLANFVQRNESAVVPKVETAETQSFLTALKNLFKTPKLVFGAAFAILVLTLGSWFLLRIPIQTEIARQITPTPTAQIIQNQSFPANQNDSDNLNANRANKLLENNNFSPKPTRESPNKNQNTNNSKRQTKIISPVLALFSGTVRADGKISELNLPKKFFLPVKLQLNLEDNIYKIYMVEIVDADGNLVLKNNNLKAKNSKINLFVPAAKLRRGDFMVRLSALNAQNENESVADYTFRVNRK